MGRDPRRACAARHPWLRGLSASSVSSSRTTSRASSRSPRASIASIACARTSGSGALQAAPEEPGGLGRTQRGDGGQQLRLRSASAPGDEPAQEVERSRRSEAPLVSSATRVPSAAACVRRRVMRATRSRAHARTGSIPSSPVPSSPRTAASCARSDPVSSTSTRVAAARSWPASVCGRGPADRECVVVEGGDEEGQRGGLVGALGVECRRECLAAAAARTRADGSARPVEASSASRGGRSSRCGRRARSRDRPDRRSRAGHRAAQSDCSRFAGNGERHRQLRPNAGRRIVRPVASASAGPAAGRHVVRARTAAARTAASSSASSGSIAGGRGTSRPGARAGRRPSRARRASGPTAQ